ncbi:hypothetical protein [Flavobacterium tibetense]|uniref:Lipoprotein n=1 Tax=Flavobacterium tibetense TaxID=2233533 RepID=A0A365P414_9FLAO|nr:hypothetical protein [Flavobacterium tibetense]RBA29275.1 hypothetical protein DPN68_03730 [Flavobacterium tibetense]
MKILYFLLFLIIISCKGEDRIESETYDRLSNEGLYRREYLKLHYTDSSVDYEIYVSKDNDTISNQYRKYKNGVLDSLNSVFYNLKITKTNKPNIYKGTITLYSKYKNLKLDENNQREFEFGYCIQTKDSIDIVYLNSKSETTFEFEFENYYNNKLQGVLYQLVQRDTIVNNEEMVNINTINILVDNDTITDNLFLKSYDLIKEKKFSFDKKAFKKINSN